MAVKYLLADTIAVGGTFQGKGVSGSVWTANTSGIFLWDIPSGSASKVGLAGGTLATASRIQTIDTDGIGVGSYFVVAPYREGASSFTVKAWSFVNDGDLIDNFRKIPGESGQLPFANIANPGAGGVTTLATYLAETGSAAIISGFTGDYVYDKLAWPFQ